MMSEVTATSGFRERMHDVADELGVSLDEILMMSPKRDPLNVGTTADHKKAQWFADLWQEAVAQRDDDSIHTRGLHYVIVQKEEDVEPPTGRCSWDRYRNTEKCYGYLNGAGARARVLGYVPIGGVSDEKNNQERLTEYTGHDMLEDDDLSRLDYDNHLRTPSIPRVDDEATFFVDRSIESTIRNIAQDVARDTTWRQSISVDEQKPYHIEIWSEKAIPDAVRNTARDAGCDAIVEGQGHLSYRVAHDFINRVQRAGKPAVVLYLADFDPAGEAMPSAMASKISWLDKSDALSHRVQMERLAVTADQVEALELPREPVEVSDSADAYQTMAEEWQQERGGGAVELSALEADLENFQRVVRDGVQSFTDPELPSKIGDAESDFRDELKERVIDALEESALDDKKSDVDEWLDEFNEALEEASEHLETLSDIANADVKTEWEQTIDDAIQSVDIPDCDIPEGDADPPTSPIYDSEREYLDNVTVIKGSDPRE